ncbi:MAG: hypothetical protein Q9201_003195 [Fulgogasparrea decipioides]
MDSRLSQPPLHDYSQPNPSTSRQPLTTSYAASHRLPPTSIPLSHTLPPLTSHDEAYTYPSHPSVQQRGQSSQPLYFPATTGPPNPNGSLPVYAPNNSAQYPSQQYPQSSRALQSPLNYNSQSWALQTSAPQAYQTYNTSAGSHGLPSLLPMPNGHTNQQNALFQHSQTPLAGSQYDMHQQQPQQSQPQQRSQQQTHLQQQPTHVVGSQGRRGILPSASGRPAAATNGVTGSQKATATTPVKDAEGKFPCEHCNKNYLHAKHLKRHLLRHTGVRPYSCGLCEDTFSRSDILKRHFQKCSVRRGNPTGASHLTHSRANKKAKPTAIEQLSIPPGNVSISANSAPSSQTPQQSSQTASSTPTLQSPFDLQGISSLGLGTATYQEELQNFSNRASRANSTKGSSNGMTINSRTASGPSSVGNPDSTFSYSTGRVTPESLTTSGAATPYSIPHDGRLPFSPDGSYPANNGSGLDLNNINRPHSGPAYSSSNQPQILGSANGSRHDLEYSTLSPFGHDDFNQHYQAHHDDSHQGLKADNDFSHAQYPLADSYSNYIPK